MVFLKNPPPYAALEEDFAWEKTYAAKKKAGGSTAISGLNRRLRAWLGIGSRTKDSAGYLSWFGPGNVLDIGCGDQVRVAAPMVPYGIELSTMLCERANAAMQAQGGYCLHDAGATGIWKLEESNFSGVIMHSYLEHETDVLGVLKGAYRALKPGGKVFIRVPNYGSVNRKVVGHRWCGFRHPDHVNYFTLGTLRSAAAQAGFTTILLNRWNLWFDDNIKVLLIKQPDQR